MAQDIAFDYKYGFSVPAKYVYKADKGLSKQVVEKISELKGEPDWMRGFRLKSLEIFLSKPMPSWGPDLSDIDFDSITYYAKPASNQVKSWEELPPEIKETYDKIGVPEAERNFLAGVSAQFDSEVVYENMKKEIAKLGVIFCDMDTAVKKYPEIVKEYFGKLVPPADNKFAALNSAVWSGGSFVYVPAGVKVPMPLQAYFRINAQNFGQFERTLIIAEEGSYVHYTEGCTASIYTTASLHAAVVEIFVKKGARVRYTTVQNWSHNVYNLVTKRSRVGENAVMEWVDCNIGCLRGDTYLFSEKGVVKIKDIKEGDKVYGIDLNSFKAKFFPVKAKKMTGVRDTFVLKTEKYTSIVATDNHPFLVLERDKVSGSKLYTLRWKQLKDIKKGDYIAVQNIPVLYEKEKKCEIKKIKGAKIDVKIPSTFDDEFMWLLGVYLGDGYLEFSEEKKRARRVYFAVPPEDRIRKKLEDFIIKNLGVEPKKKGICITINSVNFAEFLRSLGFGHLAKRKVIPQWVFTLPLKKRLAFIRGFIESDGYIRRSKDGKPTSIVLASSNRNLLEQVRILMISTGLRPLKILEYERLRVLYKDKAKVYKSYYLTLNYKENKLIFEKKLERRAFSKDIRFERVIEIKKGKKEKVYDIEIDGSNNFFANGILVHNSKITMKYPSCYLVGRGAKGEVLSIAYASEKQLQDTGAKMVHLAPNTSSRIVSKSISRAGGRTSYRGLVHVAPGAKNSSVFVSCDALILDEDSRSDTYPYMKIKESEVEVQHEATVERIGEEKLFYLASRGIKKEEAEGLLVNGFVEPVAKELPLEYAVELNRLLKVEMEGSVG